MFDIDLIADDKKSFWINASAGTGKTYILVRRVLCLLLRGIFAPNILCLTFTKAAAIEMDQRIKSELANWVFLDDELLTSEIYSLLGNTQDIDIIKNRARTLFASVLESNSAIRIVTIHSFAQEIVRKFSFEIGISSDFQIMNENEVLQLIEIAKINTYKLLDFSAAESKIAIENIMQYGNEFLIENMLLEVIKHKNYLKNFVKNISSHDLYANLIKFLDIQNADIDEFTTKFVNSIECHSYCNKIITNYSEKDANICIIFSNWCNQPVVEKIASIDNLISIFFTAKYEPRKKIIPVKISRDYPELEQFFLSTQEKISSYLNGINKIKTIKLSCGLYYFAMIFLKELSILKEIDNKLDYDDIIDYTYELLENNDLKDWVLYKIDNQVEHLLVDEAQDTSPIQWEIIKKITEDFFVGDTSSQRSKSIFIVGDEKQSIYSFQGASHTYLDLMKKYFSQKVAMTSKLFQINLNTSYRSSEAVLELVDDLFNQPEIKQFVSLSDEKISHHCYKKDLEGEIKIWPNVVKDSEDCSKYEIVAKNIADNIKNMIISGKKIAGKAVSAGSFMILIRKRDELYFQIIKKLQQIDIAVSGLDRMDITKHIAIKDLVVVAKFAILPKDDLLLATILKSPLFNLSEQDIFKICTARNDNIIEYLKENNEFAEIYSDLQEIIKISTYTPYDFFSTILFKMNNLSSFHARFGNIIEDYISEFLNLVLSFEKNHSKNLQLFIRWIEKSNSSVKRQLQQEENMVQILTIHGSKGLQAPIVILADACSFPVKKLPSQLLLTQELFIWLSSTMKIDLLKEVKEQSWQQTYAEYLRLLYVALTRAESSIYITGVGEAKDNSWYQLIANKITSTEEQVIIQENIDLTYNDTNINQTTIPSFLLENITIKPSKFLYLKPSEINAKSVKKIADNQMTDEQLKGIIIHKIMEYLPRENSYRYLNKFLDNINYENNLKSSIRNAIHNILQNPDYSLKTRNIYEVKLGGSVKINDILYPIIGQIDQITIEDDYIHIIDFKTSVNVPSNLSNVQNAHLMQLSIYYIMIKEIFSTEVISSLIWTEAGVIMTIDKNKLNLITKQQGVNS